MRNEKVQRDNKKLEYTKRIDYFQKRLSFEIIYTEWFKGLQIHRQNMKIDRVVKPAMTFQRLRLGINYTKSFDIPQRSNVSISWNVNWLITIPIRLVLGRRNRQSHAIDISCAYSTMETVNQFRCHCLCLRFLIRFGQRAMERERERTKWHNWLNYLWI